MRSFERMFFPGLSVTLLMTLMLGCSGQRPVQVASTAQTDEAAGAERSFMLMSINDVYRLGGIEGGRRGGLARARALREQLELEHPDLLVLHAGDFLFPSLLSNTFKGEQMVDVLNRLDGAEHRFDPRLIVVFGNHEFDRGGVAGAELLNRRLQESDFRWLRTNIVFSQDEESQSPQIQGQRLADRVLIESGGVLVGLFGLTLADEHPSYVDRFLDPVQTARESIRELREAGAEVVVALTHQGMEADLGLLKALGDEGPDLVIGGHEHQRQHKQVDGRWVLKADADAVTAWVVRVNLSADGDIRVEKRLEALGPSDPEPSAEMLARIQYWRTRHSEQFCGSQDPPLLMDCLDEVLGHAKVKLVAEELEIRKFESNFGNWIVDQARSAFAEQGAQIAFMNSGGLRLNQNLQAGPLERRHLEELLPFSTQLLLLDISGAALKEALEHSVSEWVGTGHFVQISGIAFRHDPADGSVHDLTLLGADGPRPILPEETLRLVTNDFLINLDRGQDGFSMLRPEHEVAGVPRLELKDLLIKGLAAAGESGIAPTVEGRICASGVRDHPCLAIQP